MSLLKCNVPCMGNKYEANDNGPCRMMLQNDPEHISGIPAKQLPVNVIKVEGKHGRQPKEHKQCKILADAFSAVLG
jgi:hypothetical protein